MVICFSLISSQNNACEDSLHGCLFKMQIIFQKIQGTSLNHVILTSCTGDSDANGPLTLL